MSGTHYVSFYCDDIKRTMEELKSHDVEFIEDVSDMGYGPATHFSVPGDFVLELYQPHYQKHQESPDPI
jgi:hypothetical protein